MSLPPDLGPTRDQAERVIRAIQWVALMLLYIGVVLVWMIALP